MADITAGRIPAAARIELMTAEYVVADLNRMMTLHKSLLAKLHRQSGFQSDTARVDFAECLERKHGRFAFPDPFVESVLKPLKTRIARAHDKQESQNGKVYRSIRNARARAAPAWEAPEVSIAFHFVLEDGERRLVSRDRISETLAGLIQTIQWPSGFIPEEPPFLVQSLDEMTAREWVESQPI